MPTILRYFFWKKFLDLITFSFLLLLLEAWQPFSFPRNNQFSAHTFRAQKNRTFFIISTKQNRNGSEQVSWRKKRSPRKLRSFSFFLSFYLFSEQKRFRAGFMTEGGLIAHPQPLNIFIRVSANSERKEFKYFLVFPIWLPLFLYFCLI